MNAYREWLITRVALDRVSHIVMEAAYQDRTGKMANAMPRLHGLHAITHEVAFARKLSVHEVAVAEWRKYFLGRGRAPTTIAANKRRAWLKRACKDECLRRGWEVKTDDEADALGVLAFELERMNIGRGV